MTIPKKENLTVKWIEAFHADLDGQPPSDSVKIKGTAIEATTSRNGVTYEMAELDKAAESLRGKLISLNHTEDVTDNVGVIENVIVTGKGLDYEGKAYNTGKHPYVIELLQKGLIQSVSIEALIPDFAEESGKRIARGIKFTGLGFVKTPGVEGAYASIAEALEKDYNVFPVGEANLSAGEKMTEEIKEAKPVEKAPEVTKEEVKALEEAQKKSLETMKAEMADRFTKLEESIESLRPSTKGVVSEDTTKKITEDYAIFKESKGMGIYAKHPETLY